MKKYKVVFVVLMLMLGTPLIAQETGNSVLEQFKDTPSEKVYVSLNTSLLFTGEYLFYKVYCLNDKTKQPSDISTIAYVELISENTEVVFKHKIRLEKSRGQGDFFVPTTVPSGNYKLIAYTRWMKNGAMNRFFQEDISIINPYQTNQDAVLPDLSENVTSITENRATNGEEDKRFILETDKESYPKKSKVALSIQNFRGASGYGNYNISVRKKEDLNHRPKRSPQSYIEWHAEQMANAPIFYETIAFAPEGNGELLKGRIRANSSDLALASQPIAISIPGEDFQIKVVGTDSTGLFYINLSKDYAEPQAILQVLDAPKGSYTIEILKDPPLDYSGLQFGRFLMDTNMQDAIVRRSLHNQIENGYFAVKPDTLKLDALNDPYGGAYVETLDLDEYTRFKTLDETVVELVENVWTKRNKDKTVSFKVRSFDETYEESEYDAMVFVDGVLMPDQTELLEFDSRLIKTVNTVREKFAMGGTTYFGLINLVTKDGNYYDLINATGMTKIELDRPRLPKRYFAQSYTEDTNTRIPDFRDQLLWQPNVLLEGSQMGLDFFTSEVPGEYELRLEGFSIYGRPVAITKTITVE